MKEKATLIMEMPSCCNECQLKVLPNPWAFMICGKTKKHIDTSNERPTWCPLKKLPDYYEDDSYSYTKGWNDCLDEIASEEL